MNLLIVNSVYVPGIQEVFTRRKPAKFQMRLTKQYPLSDIFSTDSSDLSVAFHVRVIMVQINEKIISKNIFFTENCLEKKIKKWSIWTFFWQWPWPDLPPCTPLCAPTQDLRGVTFQVDLTSWLDMLTWLSLVKGFEEGPEASVTTPLDKRNLTMWLVKFHCTQTQV